MVGEEYPKHIPNLKRCTPYPSIGVATTHVENANLLQDNQTFVEIDIHYESHWPGMQKIGKIINTNATSMYWVFLYDSR